MCERVFYAFMKMCKAKYPQFSHFLSIYHTGEVEKSGSTDKTNRNILAKLKLYSNSFQNDCFMRKHTFKMTPGERKCPKFRKPHLIINGQAKSGFSVESSSRFKLSTDLFPRKPALDQPDSRIDWAAATTVSCHTMFLFPRRAITFDCLLAQIQHLHRNLWDSDVFSVCVSPFAAYRA